MVTVVVKLDACEHHDGGGDRGGRVLVVGLVAGRTRLFPP